MSDPYKYYAKKYGKKFVASIKTHMITCSCGKEFPLMDVRCPGCGEDYRALIERRAKEYSDELKKKEEDILEASKVITEDYIAEQVYYPDREGSAFLIKWWKNDRIEEQPSVIDKGVKVMPCSGEEVVKQAILLPSGVEEYGTDIELDSKILSFIHKWLDVPEHIEKFGLWNIKRSWVYEKFHSLNYLRAMGDFGTGKSRFLDTLGLLHYKPISTSGATTPAPVFRIIEKWKGTLIMDEADWQKSDAAQDMIKIINCGYEKGKHIMRCDQNDADKVQFFDSFCPKILATRFPFYDKATESRCITHVMTTTRRDDIPVNLKNEFFEEARTLRNMLLLWRMRNYDKIDPEKECDLELPHIEPRVRQIVNSFVSLFNDDKQITMFKDFIVKHQEEVIEARRDTIEGQIIQAIYDYLTIEQISNISADEVIEKAGLTDRNGNPMKPRRLSSILKQMGFGKSQLKRINGTPKRCINLDEKHLFGLFEKLGLNCNDVTIVTVVTETPEKVVQRDLCGNVTIGALSASSVTTVTPLQHIEEIDPENSQQKEPEGKRETVLETIKTLVKMNGGEVQIQDVQERLGWEIDKDIIALKKVGDILESRPGWVIPT